MYAVECTPECASHGGALDATSAAQPHLRLVDPTVFRRRAMFRRRRIGAAILLGCILFGVWTLGSGARVAFGGPSVSVRSDGPALPGRSVVIAQAGDTYWSIAKSLRPTGDIRATVDALVAANGGRPLRVGDRLVVEVGDRRGR